MQLVECLQLLNLDSRASPEDVKRSFRRLAMKYHPDHGGSSQKFQQLDSAYKFLLANEHLIKKSKLIIIPKGTPIFYRILNPRKTNKGFYDKISVPFNEIENDSVLWCMWDATEFRLFLHKGMKIPTKISVELAREKLIISVSEGF